MRRALIVVCGLLAVGAGTANAQFVASPEFFVSLSQAQLGNLGYTRLRGFGARALGMGGAYIALSDDLTAASWNPAGLAQLDSSTISAGFAYSSVEPDQSVQLFGQSRFQTNFFTIDSKDPFDFAAEDSRTNLDFVGIAVPVRLTQDWRLGIGASYFSNLIFDQSLSSTVNPQRIEFGTYASSPLVGNPPAAQRSAFEITEGDALQYQSGTLGAYSLTLSARYKARLHLGLSLNYMSGDLKRQDFLWERGDFYADASDPDATLENQDFASERRAELDFSGWSANLGVLYKIGEFSFGAVYKPSYSLDVDGCVLDAVIFGREGLPWDGCGYVPTAEEARQANRYLFSGSSVDYPESYGIGVAWRPAGGWTLTADWTTTAWDGVTLVGRDVTEPDSPGEVELTFPSLLLLDDARQGVDGDPLRTEGFRQFDAEVLRLGVEYVMPIGSLLMPLRAGVFFEDAFRNFPGIDEPIRVEGITVGLGLIKLRSWNLDLAAVYETMDQNLAQGPIQDGDPAYTIPRRFTERYVPADFWYDPGSEFSQDALRVLVNASYIF